MTPSPSSSGPSPSSRRAVSRSRRRSRCTSAASRSRLAASGCSATRNCASSSSWRAPAVRSRPATSAPRTRPRTRPRGRCTPLSSARRDVEVEAEPVLRVVARLDRGQAREALVAEGEPDALDRLVDRGVVGVAGAAQGAGPEAIGRRPRPGDRAVVERRVLPDTQGARVPGRRPLAERGPALRLDVGRPRIASSRMKL